MSRAHNKYLALKVDVDTLRGTREGVPRLLDLFKKHQCDATFLFSLGPDHTGRAIKRALRPGFLNKVSRTSVLSHYGLPTLLYGTLLPGPDIGQRCVEVLRRVRDEGFEVGIHTWDHVKWQDGVQCADAAWVQREMQLACNRFTDIFREAPRTHGAAGWQMNLHALRQTQHLGFDYCSDGRGTHPYLPVVQAEIIDCPQIPTTLPTLDELIGLNGCTRSNVHERVLQLTQELVPHHPVFTLHAELEGMQLAGVMEKLICGWKEQGYQLVTTRHIFATLERTALSYHEVVQGSVAGRSGKLMLQGSEFLSDAAA